MDIKTDAVQWFVDGYGSKGIRPSPDQITCDMLMLSLASFLNTAATTFSIIYDLLDRPESLEEIEEEVARNHKETGGNVTRQALGQLVNFMKES